MNTNDPAAALAETNALLRELIGELRRGKTASVPKAAEPPPAETTADEEPRHRLLVMKVFDRLLDAAGPETLFDLSHALRQLAAQRDAERRRQ